MRKAMAVILLGFVMTGCATQKPIVERYGTASSFATQSPKAASPMADVPAIIPQACNCFGFDASKSSSPQGEALTYMFDFGDGQNAAGNSVSHCFDVPGDHTVTLTVHEASGDVCGVSSSQTVVKSRSKPIAMIEVIKP